MKREKIIALILVVAISCGALIYAQTTTSKETKIQWEYMIYPASGNMTFNINQGNTATNTSSFVSEMNKLGTKGWEIIEIGSNAVVLKRMMQPSQGM